MFRCQIFQEFCPTDKFPCDEWVFREQLVWREMMIDRTRDMLGQFHQHLMSISADLTDIQISVAQNKKLKLLFVLWNCRKRISVRGTELYNLFHILAPAHSFFELKCTLWHTANASSWLSVKLLVRQPRLFTK